MNDTNRLTGENTMENGSKTKLMVKVSMSDPMAQKTREIGRMENNMVTILTAELCQRKV